MTAELEFYVGGVTTDTVEDVCRQILDDLTNPHSPFHPELRGTGPDGLGLDNLKIKERNNSTGTTIVIVFLGLATDAALSAATERMIDALWEAIKRRFDDGDGRGPGERIK